MFLKQTTYKPRSGSQSSQGGQNQEQSKPASSPKAEATPRKSTDVTPGAISAAAAGRRRSSAAGQAYAGLNQYKRSSQDASATERKAAWSEQKGATGVLGGMWNSFTKGS